MAPTKTHTFISPWKSFTIMLAEGGHRPVTFRNGLFTTTNKELADKMEGKVPSIHVVGDCAEPAKLMEATAAGFIAGQEM